MTPSHPILTTAGWKSRNILLALREHHVATTWLNVGDEVICYGENAQILSIHDLIVPEHYDTYNLSIDDLHTYMVEGVVVHNVMMAVSTKFASGGLDDYTGPAWLDGTPSHPEYVLNPKDTEHMFNVIGDAAKLDSNTVNNIVKTLNMATYAMLGSLGAITAGTVMSTSSAMNQSVEIHADFPNVTERSEIEAAFDDLINRATQYANRK